MAAPHHKGVAPRHEGVTAGPWNTANAQMQAAQNGSRELMTLRTLSGGPRHSRANLPTCNVGSKLTLRPSRGGDRFWVHRPGHPARFAQHLLPTSGV